MITATARLSDTITITAIAELSRDMLIKNQRFKVSKLQIPVFIIFQDGSDEPGTSACNNARFYCENAGHKAALLLSSR